MLSLLLVAAGGVPVPGRDSVTKSLSAAAGGTVVSASGGLTLTIPAGALEKDTTVTVEETAPGEGVAVGPVYKLGPEGLKFLKPATLTLRFKPGDVPQGFEKEDVAVTAFRNGSKAPGVEAAKNNPAALLAGRPWDYLDSEVDPAGGAVSALIEHFSRFAARAYSSYALGSGPGVLKGATYDFQMTDAQMDGSGYAEARATVLHGGEFFQKAGAKVGEPGGGIAFILQAKNFRAKAGKKGQRSASRAQITVDIDHAAVVMANFYAIDIGVFLIDLGSGKLLGNPYFPVQALGPGQIVMAGYTTRNFFANAWMPIAANPFYGPPYKPGTHTVLFDGCELQAGRFYTVMITLLTSVGGQKGDGGLPPLGGEIIWNGPFSPGNFLVRAIRIEG